MFERCSRLLRRKLKGSQRILPGSQRNVIRLAKLKRTTISSSVFEETDKWIKASAKAEGVSPSLWIATLLTYSAMTDTMTKGEISAIVHDLLNVSQLINKKFDFNPFNRFQKNHPEDVSEGRKEKAMEQIQEK
jgi:hypothetical protein